MKDFKEILKNNTLIYHYIRGSHAYGTNTIDSDIDTAGWYIQPKDVFYGLPNFINYQLHDEKNDNVFYEIGEAFKLLLNSNPNMIESLFIPDRCIIYQDKITSLIKENKELFITKQLYNTFGGYAKSQIHKMIGLNKAIVNPIYTRLTPLDFCYTFINQGSIKLHKWLTERGLKEKYCGLVNINNMHDIYGLYYDLNAHIINEIITLHINTTNFTIEELKEKINLSDYIINMIKEKNLNIKNIDINTIKPIGYKGILNNEKTSNELRLSSIPKGEMPLCNISYNLNGYTKHCLDYKRYQEWTKNRNPIRYCHNLKQNYDTKNASHLIRLIHTCTEALNGNGINIDRTNIDNKLLLDIRNGKIEYNILKKMVENDSILMDEAYKNSSLQDNVNISEINQLLIDVRTKFYN